MTYLEIEHNNLKKTAENLKGLEFIEIELQRRILVSELEYLHEEKTKTVI